MTYTADPHVDAYINALPVWRQAVCREVRELIHTAVLSPFMTAMRVNYRPR